MTGLNEEDYGYPLADVSHLTEDEKEALLRRGRMLPKDLHSDEEFEQWLAIYAPREAEGSSICICGDGRVECTEPDKEKIERTIKVIADYERGEWYFKK